MQRSESRAGAGGAGVQNVTDNASAGTLEGGSYGALRALQRFSSLPRQRAVCLRQAQAAGVTIGRRDDRLAVSGAAVCGVRSCPVCGPKIQAGRRDEIHEAVTAARALGWELRFLTLTLRHRSRDRLEDTLEALLACCRGLVSGRAYADQREDFGLVGTCRVIECKHGCEHGWHPHAHYLLFFDPKRSRRTPEEGLFDQLRERWYRLTKAAGYAASVKGQAFVDVTDRELDQLASYFTKEGADPIAWELTGADTKTRGVSLNPHELLQLAVAGDPGAIALYREYEQATKGRRMVAWTPGLRRELAQLAPREDVELAELSPVTPAECLVVIPRAAYDALVDPVGLLGQIADQVAAGVDAESLAWWLTDRGVAVVIPRPLPPAVLERVTAPPGCPDWLALPAEPVGAAL